MGTWRAVLFLQGACYVLAGLAALGPASSASALEKSQSALFNRGEGPIAVGRLPAGIDSPASSECELCHVRQAREWEESLHRQSWTQPTFQKAFAREPFQECKNCHQPLTATQPASARVVALQREGITCAVCHLRDGAILASQVSGRAPHPVRAVAELRSPAFCGGCHQFPFPDRLDDGRVVATELPMQDTVGEWERVAARAPAVGTCLDCHMPWIDGPRGQRHRSHRFLGSYDAETLQRAVEVRPQLRRTAADSVDLQLTLTAHAVGHAVPTGDLFRSLVIEVSAVDDAGTPIGAAQQRALARSFYTKIIRDGQGLPRLRRLQSADTRLLPEVPRALDFNLPLPARTAAVRFQVTLHRLPPGKGRSAADDSISPVAQGQIPLPPSPFLAKGVTP